MQSDFSTTVINNRKRIESFYVLKALAAFFVVLLHVPAYCPELVPVVGVGTPCFLCITGYLLYSADYERERFKCIKWAKKTMRLALVCNLIYGALRLFLTDWNVGGYMFYITALFHGGNISHPLWYLTGLWEALLIFVVVIRYVPKLIHWFPLLAVVGYMLRTHGASLFPQVDAWTLLMIRDTALFTSLPFLSIGYLIHKHSDYLLRKICVECFFLASLIGAFAEYYLRVRLQFDCSCFLFFTYPLIVSMMLLCVKYPNFTIPVVGVIGKKHSPNIYYFHMLFVWCIKGLGIQISYPIITAACIYMATIPLSYAFIKGGAYWQKKVWPPLLALFL